MPTLNEAANLTHVMTRIPEWVHEYHLWVNLIRLAQCLFPKVTTETKRIRRTAQLFQCADLKRIALSLALGGGYTDAVGSAVEVKRYRCSFKPETRSFPAAVFLCIRALQQKSA